MHATIRVYPDHPTLADALAERQDEVKDVLNGIDGFTAYYLVKTATGAVSVSVYETAEGSEESTRAAAAWIRENLSDVGGAAPEVFSGDVVIEA